MPDGHQRRCQSGSVAGMLRWRHAPRQMLGLALCLGLAISVGLSQPVAAVPPYPVLFVHGFWSSANTWAPQDLGARQINTLLTKGLDLFFCINLKFFIL